MRGRQLICRLNIIAVISLVAYNPVLPFFAPTASAVNASVVPIETIPVTDAPQAFASGDTVTVSGATELDTLVRVMIGEQSLAPAIDGQGFWMASFQRVPAGIQKIEVTTRSIVGVKTVDEALFVTVESSLEKLSGSVATFLNAPVAPPSERVEWLRHGQQYDAGKDGNGTDHLFQSQHKTNSHSPVDLYKKKHAHKRLTNLPTK